MRLELIREASTVCIHVQCFEDALTAFSCSFTLRFEFNYLITDEHFKEVYSQLVLYETKSIMATYANRLVNGVTADLLKIALTKKLSHLTREFNETPWSERAGMLTEYSLKYDGNL